MFWRALLVGSPFFRPFFIGTEPLWMTPLSITARQADSLAGWCLRWQTQSFCSKSWCLLVLSECGNVHSWRASVCWVEVRCLHHNSGMKQELSSRWERREHGWRVRKSVWWGQMDPQLGCCSPVLVGEAKGRCSTAEKDSNVVPGTTSVRWDVWWWSAGGSPESLAYIISSVVCQQWEVRQVYLAQFLLSSEGRKAIFWPFLRSRLWYVQSLKWVLLLNWGHRDVTFHSLCCVSCSLFL